MPTSHPETSQNYYSSVVDASRIDPNMASILLNGKGTEKSAVESEQTYEQASEPENNVYEPIWANAPAVPKRKDLSENSQHSLLDKPLSPQEIKSDPFDTSSVTQMMPSSTPLLPSSTREAVQNGTSTAGFVDPVFPSVPPRPKPDDHVLNEFDGLIDFGSASSQAPPSSPPPSPPISSSESGGLCLPPPPPRRTDIPMCNNELIETVGTLNLETELKGPPVAVRRNVGGEQVIAPPPVPARPAVSLDTELANQQVELETPPIPARPAPPPPIPKRPAV